MNWSEILSLRAWTPLSEIGATVVEPIIEGVFKVGAHAYLRTQPYNKRLEMGDARAPFITMAYWSPSVDGLMRLILADPSFCADESIATPPRELALGTTGRYLELIEQARKIEQKVVERAVYSNKGIFLKKSVDIGLLSYCFMNRQERDENAFAIEISLQT